MAPHRALLRSIESRFMVEVPLLHPVLDVGCGDGHFASVTFSEPIDVGLDPWERDLVECATLRPQVYKELVLASATEMPFADESFQTVISNSVLEHIPDVEMTVREIARVTSVHPGSTLGNSSQTSAVIATQKGMIPNLSEATETAYGAVGVEIMYRVARYNPYSATDI